MPATKHATRSVMIAALLLTVGTTDGRLVQRSDRALDPAGRSVTQLPNGRLLVIGGQGTERSVGILDPVTGRTAPVSRGPETPRSWHTATLLADGGILIAGGVDASGRLVNTVERLDLGTELFQTISSAGLSPRMGHTATVLSDGRVLFLGGNGPNGTALNTADVWDSQTGGSPIAAPMGAPRRGHSAALLGDGRVLIASGLQSASPNASSLEIYDSRSQSFQAIDAIPIEQGQQTPLITGASPSNGDVDVPVTTRMALRFSPSLDVRSLHPGTVRLTTDGEPVDAFVVPVENGRLAFITPSGALQPGSVYVLSIAGAVDQQGRQMPPAVLQFTTVKDEPDAPVVDDEVWMPDANGWRTNRPPSPWQSLPPLQAPVGVTALAGQVLRLNGAPLAGVTLEIDGHTAETDRSGRFLLLAPGVSSGYHELVIDGATASNPARRYGLFEARTALNEGRTTALPFTIWMPRIDTAHAVPIPSPTRQETVVTTPLIPGLEVHLPPNTVIRNDDQQVVHELSITPIPIDRPPFPLPEYFNPPVYFTIQPGGAYVYTYGPGPRGARLIYPNLQKYPRDRIVEFWHYEPDEKGWFVYGTGSATADGRQIVPRPGIAVYEFTGAMINGYATPPSYAPKPGEQPKDGEPVDLGTGLFVLTKSDLYLPDVIPLALTRTYRPNDSESRPFGIGATHPYRMFLWSAQMYQEADLVLPDGARVHYVRTSSGTGFTDAVFEHTSSPTAFYKSVITWNGNGWDLKLKDGAVYVFGNEAPLQSIRDRYGNTITLTWSSTNFYGSGYGNILKVMASSGRFFEFTYDASNRITQAKDNIGRTVGYQYDASGRLWKVTDPIGGVTEYTYDASHRVLTLKDARGIVFLTNQYDANGRVTLQTQADNTTFQFAYTLNGSAVTQTDVTNPRGYIDRWAFNTDGYATSRVEAVGQSQQRTTTFTRQTGSNFVQRVTDPLNRQTAYAYDSKGNVTSVTRLDGTSDAVTTTFTYESTFNQIASVTDPLNHTTSFTYDGLGRLITVTDPLNHATTLAYNERGLPVSVMDALNQTTQFGYNVTDVISLTDPLGRTTQRFVDAAGRPITITNPLGQTTRYQYDNLSRITSITDAIGGQTTFTYDANSNLLTLTDGRNNTTTYTYNNMDHVATRTDPLTRQESYTYNNNGNLLQVTDRKAQVTAYTYDALDRRTLVSYHDASTTAFTYDAGDRLTGVTDSLAGTITRAWDGLNRLTSETTPEGLVSYTYDATNRRATMTVNGQTAVSYSYDNRNRVSAITQGTATVSFGYDNADRRTSLTLPNGIVVTYTYDSASQITGLTYRLGGNTLGSLAYTYDVAGNRTVMSGSYARTGLPSPLTSATYNAGNQIATWGGTTFSYDNNGNLTNDGSRTYTWNARDELTALGGSVTASFQYDAFGRRRSRTVNGTSRSFLYDGLNLVQELVSGSAVANLLIGLSIDETFARTLSGATETLLTDGLGSTIALANASGSVQTEYTYAPFGATTTAGVSSTNSAQYTGRENDETGLYAYRARFYSPTLQRFVSEDRIGFRGGDPNLHAYVRNGPTQAADPLGLQTINERPWPIWIKPEDGGPWRCLEPGDYDPTPTDGLTDLAGKPGSVWKNPTGSGTRVPPSGDPVTTYPPPSPDRPAQLTGGDTPTYFVVPQVPGFRSFPGLGWIPWPRMLNGPPGHPEWAHPEWGPPPEFPPNERKEPPQKCPGS